MVPPNSPARRQQHTMGPPPLSCTFSLALLHLPSTQASPLEQAEALTLAGAPESPLSPRASPAPALPVGRVSRWVRVPRVGTGAETTPPRCLLPERAHYGCPRRRDEEAGGEEGPGPLTSPSPPRSHGRVGAGLGIGQESGQGAQSSRVPAGPARTWGELAGCSLQGPPTRTMGRGGRPGTAEEPEAGRRRMVQETAGSRGTATPPGHSNTSCSWGAPGPPLVLALRLL